MDGPMRRAMELAWESFRAGSLGVGAVITDGDATIAEGRNRLAEQDPGDDVLAGTSLAHAELNALAKLRWGAHPDGVNLWTTLQPCLQCLGAIRIGPVHQVHVLAPDPLFRGVENARHLNEFIGSRWPTFVQEPIDEWAVLALLFQAHAFAFWQTPLRGWADALPTTAVLADELVRSAELVDHVQRGADVDTVAQALWVRLSRCVTEVAALAEA